MEAAALGGTHIDAYAWRDVSRLLVNTLTIDEIVTYTELADTGEPPLQVPFQLQISTADTANFTRGSRAIAPEVLPEIDRHLSSVLGTYATYTHTTTTQGTNMTVDRSGMIFTRQAVMIVFDGQNVIEMPLTIDYDGEGIPHHRLQFPYPVDASISYTSVTVRYFLNPFLAADGSMNTASSIELRDRNFLNSLIIPMSETNRTDLMTAITDSDVVQVHFTGRDGIPVVYDIISVQQNTHDVANIAYGGYVLANVALMGFTATNSLPADSSAITFVINGTSGSGDSGAGQTGFSVEHIGIITATASQPNENITYRWPDDITNSNISGLNGWGYDASDVSLLVEATPTLQEIYDASAQFINSSGAPKTIRTISVDFNILTRGDGNNTTIRLQLVHFDGTTYTSVRTAVQTTSLTGFRTFDFTLGTPQTVAPGEFLSITATDAVINQSIEVAGVRLSTTSATWLNPVQPVSYTHLTLPTICSV